MSLTSIFADLIPHGCTLRSLPPVLGSAVGIESCWLEVPKIEFVAGETSREHSFPFFNDIPFREEQKTLCIARWQIWWMIPRLLTSTERDCPTETYLLVGQLVDNSHICLIPVFDKCAGFSLEGSLTDGLHINAQITDDLAAATSSSSHKACLISRGDDPIKIIEHSMAKIKAHLYDNVIDHNDSEKENDEIDQSIAGKEERLSWTQTFGWCTWDSFYTDLSTDKVLQGLASFGECGVVPRFLILDDGWQSTNCDHAQNGEQWAGRLVGFQCNHKFKDGSSVEVEVEVEAEVETVESESDLSTLVKVSKEQYGIETFMCWHTLSGYWAGVCDSHGDMQKFAPQLSFPVFSDAIHRISHTDKLHGEPFTLHGVGLVQSETIDDFFGEYHDKLVEYGVDGVKVDAQSVLSLIHDERVSRTVAQDYHIGLRKSIKKSFLSSPRMHPCNSPIIHCMCHSQHTLLTIGALYSKDSCPPVVRGSDDFWPLVDHSHGPHVFVNAMNSLLVSFVGKHDWDMFQTNLGESSHMHAVSRALSGGPVYVSDTPEAHNAEILNRLAFRDGSLPMSIRNARPVAEMIYKDVQRERGAALCIQNANPAGGLVIGVFNVFGSVLENDKDMFRPLHAHEVNVESSANMKTTVKARMVEEYDESRSYVGYRYSDQQVVISDSSASIDVDVFTALEGEGEDRKFGYDIVSFAPLYASASKGFQFACVGATDKYNSGGSVLSVVAKPEEGMFTVKVLGEGKVLFIHSGATLHVVECRDRAGGSLDVSIASEKNIQGSKYVASSTQVTRSNDSTCSGNAYDITLRIH